MCSHLILLLLPKQTLQTLQAQKKTSEDQSLIDSTACPVLNASKVPLTDFETSQLSKVSISVQHCMGSITNRLGRFRRLRLMEPAREKTPAMITQMNLLRVYTTLRNISCTDPRVLENMHRANVENLSLTLMLLSSTLKSSLTTKIVPGNLMKEERSVLQKLKNWKNRDDIVIKKADKRPTVVALNKQTYLAEANRVTDNRQTNVSTRNWTLIPQKSFQLSLLTPWTKRMNMMKLELMLTRRFAKATVHLVNFICFENST